MIEIITYIYIFFVLGNLEFMYFFAGFQTKGKNIVVDEPWNSPVPELMF